MLKDREAKTAKIIAGATFSALTLAMMWVSKNWWESRNGERFCVNARIQK
jgi:hypothetical protein